MLEGSSVSHCVDEALHHLVERLCGGGVLPHILQYIATAVTNLHTAVPKLSRRMLLQGWQLVAWAVGYT